MPRFIGRDHELADLQRFLKKKTASLLVVRGRRRVGKSRLIEEFAKPHRFVSFIGLAPTDRTSRESELAEFSRQFTEAFDTPPVAFNDWSDAFRHLARQTAKGRIVILLDEISWMGSKHPDFLGKLKTAWDTQFKKNDNLILVLCGSASMWIEENIVSSRAFVGRISLKLTLEELPLRDCARFWPDRDGNISAYEKAKILAVTGGVPRYLEEIDPAVSSEANIRQLCFVRSGLLVSEFHEIFNDLFLHDSPLYERLVGALLSGPKENQEITDALSVRPTGRISQYLEELTIAGFIKRDYTWDIKSGDDKPKQSRYRLSDNYIRFYLKYMEKHLTRIERDIYRFKSLETLPEWPAIMGLQFENLVLNSRQALHAALHLDANSVVTENPYFQTATVSQRGCQIDFMIQSRFSSLYVCEIRFSAKPVGAGVIKEVQQKIDCLKRPKNFSCRPVLVHINGVSPEVLDSDYFAAIVDMSELLR